MKHRILISLVTLLLCACSTPVDSAPSAKERGRLSAQMVNLSSAVDAYFADLPQAPTDSDATILQMATRHDKRAQRIHPTHLARPV